MKMLLRLIFLHSFTRTRSSLRSKMLWSSLALVIGARRGHDSVMNDAFTGEGEAEASQAPGSARALETGAPLTSERPAAEIVSLVSHSAAQSRRAPAGPVSFDRRELQTILNVYGRQVAAGEWRDYAIDFSPAKAVFAIFRRTSEAPLYRVEKNPALAARQGAYALVAADGRVLKRGRDLQRVLAVIDVKLKLVK
jgi:hypothetical protein